MRGISSGRRLALLGATVVAGLATQASVALAVVPTVATQAATGVMIQAATLRGTVNPRSLATSYFFQYGPTAAYGAQTAPASLAAGAAAVRVTAAAGALVPATTYHFRLVATNATGTSVTADRTFRTPAQALRVALAATPNPTSFGGPTTLVGTVTGTGAAGRPVQIQQRAFPFAGGFANVGNALVTDARGRFSMAVLSLPVTTQFRARVTDRAGIVSPVLPVGARAVVGTRVTSTNVRRGGRVHFSGTVRPSEPGRGSRSRSAATGAGSRSPGRSRDRAAAPSRSTARRSACPAAACTASSSAAAAGRPCRTSGGRSASARTADRRENHPRELPERPCRPPARRA